MREVLSGHLAPGSVVVVHDRERAHGGAITDAGCVSESNNKVGLPRPGLLRGDGDGQQHVLLAQALPLAVHWHVADKHAVYLDWYVYLFRVNQARDRWDPTARVLRPS